MRRFIRPFRSAASQNVIVGIICFCGPGMFNALNGLGDAGGNDPAIASAMNAVVYLCFAVSGLSGGLAYKLLGGRTLLSVGALTYCAYAWGAYAWGAWGASWLALLGAGLLGFGAGGLWTSQGVITLSFAAEHEKGHFVAVFWCIFNLGGLFGGMLTFLLNSGIDASDAAGGVSATTYFVFIAVMVAGALLALCLVVSPEHIVRSDGSSPARREERSLRHELALVVRVPTERFMLLLTPLLISSNWAYTYNFNALNAALFNARTRGLNAAFFWGAQMLAAWALGKQLDGVWWPARGLGRRSRALLGSAIVYAAWVAQSTYALAVQFGTYGSSCPSKADTGCAGPKIDVASSRWPVPGLLFAFMGVADAFIQSYCLWLIGSHTSDPYATGRYGGYFKGVQSAGAGVAWMIDALGVEFAPQLVVGVCLVCAGAPFVILAARAITDGIICESDATNCSLRAEVQVQTLPSTSVGIA